MERVHRGDGATRECLERVNGSSLAHHGSAVSQEACLTSDANSRCCTSADAACKLRKNLEVRQHCQGRLVIGKSWLGAKLLNFKLPARRPAGKESEDSLLAGHSGQRTNRNTGYLRHHRPLGQERPQHELRELLLRQVHQCIGNNSVHEFDGQPVPDRRISRMSPVARLQP